MTDSDPDMASRIKAARALVGVTTLDDLADRIGEAGLAKRTLRKIESGQRTAQPREVRAIADALGVPLAFFYGPLLQHEGPASGFVEEEEVLSVATQLTYIGSRLERIEAALASVGIDPDAQRGLTPPDPEEVAGALREAVRVLAAAVEAPQQAPEAPPSAPIDLDRRRRRPGDAGA